MSGMEEMKSLQPSDSVGCAWFVRRGGSVEPWSLGRGSTLLAVLKTKNSLSLSKIRIIPRRQPHRKDIFKRR